MYPSKQHVSGVASRGRAGEQDPASLLKERVCFFAWYWVHSMLSQRGVPGSVVEIISPFIPGSVVEIISPFIPGSVVEIVSPFIPGSVVEIISPFIPGSVVEIISPFIPGSVVEIISPFIPGSVVEIVSTFIPCSLTVFVQYVMSINYITSIYCTARIVSLLLWLKSGC